MGTAFHAGFRKGACWEACLYRPITSVEMRGAHVECSESLGSAWFAMRHIVVSKPRGRNFTNSDPVHFLHRTEKITAPTWFVLVTFRKRIALEYMTIQAGTQTYPRLF